MLVYTKADGTQTYYVYGLGLIGQEQAGSYLAYHFYFRGSTVALTDETGIVTERFQYSPYGVLVDGEVETTPFLFNGMYGVMSDGNGLYHMRARYYSPEIRRFVNQDILLGSVSEGQTLNRYAFVTGRPVSFVDPFGLEGVLIFTTEANPENEKQPWAHAALYQYSKVNEELSIVYHGLFIEFHDVKTVTEVNNILSTTPNIVRIIFIGHASSKAIYVGSSDAPDSNISERGSKNDVVPQNMNWDNLTPNARIEILGCKAGKGENSIAQALANASGVSVIAPDASINFEKNGKPFIRWFRRGKWIRFYPKKTQ
ncbi:MAG: hypothetical protein DRR19_22005 [Candidatus Parabeggiatoa sp. nov. 1]|nr:MAG: hypothetical protein DRR19_22005 [Gammaproteobacteria bacterium]